MPDKKKAKWNIVMVTEPTPSVSIIPNPHPTSERDRFVYGPGSIIFEQLNRIIYHYLLDKDFHFDKIELLFFKWDCRFIPSRSGSADVNYCEDFFKYIMGDYARDQTEYFLTGDDYARLGRPLCTGQALHEALNYLDSACKNATEPEIKSVLVFVSDNPDVFNDPYMSGFEADPAVMPDFSIFVLNDEAVRRSASVLSQFNTSKYGTGIFSFRSVAEDTAAFYAQLGSDASIDSVVTYSLNHHRGTAYALYGMLKDVFGINRSIDF